MANEIHYIKKKAPLSEIKKIDHAIWLPYKSIYKGLDNGMYWFKIVLEPSEQSQIISIPESHITRAFLFLQNQKFQPLKNNRYLAFEVKPNLERTICYLQVNCRLEARIPLTISNVKQYYHQEQYQFLISGIYYGIVIGILLVNFLCYITFRNATYLHYIFMTFGMAANAVYKDGLIALCFGMNGINEYIEPSINSILGISSIFFTASYLQIHQYYPRVYKTGIILMLISQVFNLGVFITQGDILLYMQINS